MAKEFLHDIWWPPKGPPYLCRRLQRFCACQKQNPGYGMVSLLAFILRISTRPAQQSPAGNMVAAKRLSHPAPGCVPQSPPAEDCRGAIITLLRLSWEATAAGAQPQQDTISGCRHEHGAASHRNSNRHKQ